MHYRKDIRATVKAALAADTQFDAYTVRSAWAQPDDDSEYPIIGVATPRETKGLSDHSSSERVTNLTVAAIMRGGDDIEDQLDDLSGVLEQLVIDAVGTQEIECDLRETDINLDGSAGGRLGMLTMTFAVTQWLAEPFTAE